MSPASAPVRTRNISCIKGDKTIDQPINYHVSFMGKNGVKGEVVMRNGKILGWAWGAGFVDGIGQGIERASQPAVGWAPRQPSAQLMYSKWGLAAERPKVVHR